MYARRAFLHFWKLLFFSLTSYPGEMAYFNSPNRQLSNGALVMELYWNRNVDPSRSPCLKTIDRKSLERSNFLVLRPALLKLHILTQVIDSFPLPHCPKSCDKEKLSIPLEAHHNSQSSEIFQSFPSKNWKSCNFLSYGQSCWNCIFKRPR